MFRAYANYWKNYTNFSERSRRAEYWWPMMINTIIGIILGFLLMGQLMDAFTNSEVVLGSFGQMLTIILILFYAANVIPGLAVTVRRLHDTGRSGWWYFISCVPVAGAILLLVFMFQEGTPGDNQYGADPKRI